MRPPACTLHPSRYQAGCDTCRARRTHYNKHRLAGIANGTRRPPISIATVKGHLRGLMNAGMREADIVRASGYSPGFVGKILRTRTQKTVTCGVADIFLAIEFAPGQAWLIDGTGTQRRLQALAAAGWSIGGLSTRLGYHRTRLEQLVRKSAVTPETAARVKDLYRELSGQAGTSAHARNRAAAKQWPPPAAWDDDTIEDPAAKPNYGRKSAKVLDEEFIELALTGDRTVAQLLSGPERRAAIHRARQRNMPETAVSHLFAISERTRLRMVATGRKPADQIESAA